ncbi:MAG: hypothetical protein Kow0080_28370 [Candidatus Promineifilaceae bacterium]
MFERVGYWLDGGKRPFPVRAFVSLPVLFVLAWLPRLAAIGRYITPDELIWVFRSVSFWEALKAGDWPATMTSGHPGVTTTWLGALGIQLQLWFFPASQDAYNWVTKLAFMTPDNMEAFRQLAVLLNGARMAVTAVNAVGIVAIFWLCRQLWGEKTAWLAALLLSFDPFISGLSGLLHVDGLMTTFATIALLAWAAAIFPGVVPQKSCQRAVCVVVAGAATALALLTKSPAVLLIPFAGMFLLVGAWLFGESGLGESGRDYGRFLFKYGFIWASVTIVVILLLFPALWQDAATVFTRASSDANRHIDTALRPTFFMGKSEFEHGPLFYPVVLLFRLSPVVILGLLFTIGSTVKTAKLAKVDQNKKKHTSLRFRLSRLELFKLRTSAIWLLWLWAILFLAGITLAEKKFDRYALPALPVLVVTAAYGWQHLISQWRRKWGETAVIATQLLWLLTLWPYPLAAYNPLVGGPWLADKVMALGWGESISAAGQWLAAQPESGKLTAAAGVGPSFAPFFPGKALLSSEESVPYADYFVLTVGGEQLNPGSKASAMQSAELVHTIRFAGREQAWIFHQPDPQPMPQLVTPLPDIVSFANHFRVLGLGAQAAGNAVQLAVQWEKGAANGRYTVQLQLKDNQNNVWASAEFPLVNDIAFYPENWQPGEQPIVVYKVKLPDTAPPGQYRVALSLFQDGQQMAVLAADGTFQGVTLPGPWVDAAGGGGLAAAAVPVPLSVSWLNDTLHLQGRSELPPTLAAGFSAVVDLYWQATAPLPAGLQGTVLLGETAVWQDTLSPYDSGQWQPGQWVQAKVPIKAPVNFAAGTYPLSLVVTDANGTPLAEPVTLGSIDIVAIDRQFELPPDIAYPLMVTFGEFLTLRGVDGGETAVSPGGTVEITLYWEVNNTPDLLLSAFVHVIGQDGLNAAQGDQWPGGLPANTRVPGEIITDRYAITLPDRAAGRYQLGVGVYLPESGTRLAAKDAEGTAVPDNRYMLPITLEVTTNE